MLGHPLRTRLDSIPEAVCAYGAWSQVRRASIPHDECDLSYKIAKSIGKELSNHWMLKR